MRPLFCCPRHMGRKSVQWRKLKHHILSYLLHSFSLLYSLHNNRANVKCIFLSILYAVKFCNCIYVLRGHGIRVIYIHSFSCCCSEVIAIEYEDTEPNYELTFFKCFIFPVLYAILFGLLQQQWIVFLEKKNQILMCTNCHYMCCNTIVAQLHLKLSCACCAVVAQIFWKHTHDSNY